MDEDAALHGAALASRVDRADSGCELGLQAFAAGLGECSAGPKERATQRIGTR